MVRRSVPASNKCVAQLWRSVCGVTRLRMPAQCAASLQAIQTVMDQVRQRTKRGLPLRTKELIAELNPLLRGWGEYYKRAQVRKLFQRLDGWIRRRIWSHRYRRWRNAGWKQLPATKL
jgi:Group II intron, maturase-specific domain